MSYLQVYKGKCFSKWKTTKPTFEKIFVFDLDETIGSFRELILIWNQYLKKADNSTVFRFLDLYPECLRYGILSIFDVLLKKKQSGELSAIFFYTNNIYSPEWPIILQKYLDYKMNTTNFIDNIVGAFKNGTKIIEPKRRSIHKTYTDFLRCTLISRNTEICFIDDTYYDKMAVGKVFYIQPLAYLHKLSRQTVIDRFLNAGFLNISSSEILAKYTREIQDIFQQMFGNEDTTSAEMFAIDIEVSKKMMYTVREFFYLSTRAIKTYKRSSLSTNYTYKTK